jgi:hypothetical protein
LREFAQGEGEDKKRRGEVERNMREKGGQDMIEKSQKLTKGAYN